jgi:hypothetical protein
MTGYRRLLFSASVASRSCRRNERQPQTNARRCMGTVCSFFLNPQFTQYNIVSLIVLLQDQTCTSSIVVYSLFLLI